MISCFISDQQAPSIARLMHHAITTASAIAISDLWVGRQERRTFSIKISLFIVGNRQPIGATRIAEPFVTPLATISSSATPCAMACKDDLDVGPKIFFSKALHVSTHLMMCLAMTSGSILPSHSKIAFINAMHWCVSSVNSPALNLRAATFSSGPGRNWSIQPKKLIICRFVHSSEGIPIVSPSA